ncbi:hypothetical protein OPV22_007187 [Ensete ventricosum]|uniref:Uncharacterized protein n=1 Tax=Ensete ventricosum TaxID=4639 RepID=A0AAV8RME1_ENSVE|nr:hypothetical protein OPV22_007187 [Ensete ventricosum]
MGKNKLMSICMQHKNLHLMMSGECDQPNQCHGSGVSTDTRYRTNGRSHGTDSSGGPNHLCWEKRRLLSIWRFRGRKRDREQELCLGRFEHRLNRTGF